MLGFYERIGMAAWLMTKSAYSQYPTACIAAWIEPAVLHNKIHFFLGEDKKPFGYMTWALLANDSEQRLLHDPDVLLHISEWNEGNELWILDLVLVGGDIRQRIREIRAIFPQFTYAKSLRRTDDGVVRKIVRWKKLKRDKV